jgi:isopentenyl-diphosphate delta-isomerase
LKESVILVDTGGQAIGMMDKLEAHQNGNLHLAFSVFIFNSKGQLLLQQRALDKYHSGGLWTNTCCSHPRAGETIIDAGRRRLKEEMGMETELTELFQFSYRHEFENGLIEHEYDHVLIGISDQLPEPDPDEVADFRYMNTGTLVLNLMAQPDIYTPWFRICLDRVLKNYHQMN